MTRKIISTRRLKSGTFNSPDIEIDKRGEFHEFCPFKGFDSRREDAQDADLIVCSLRGASDLLADNKGTPVVLVDSFPDPSITQSLVDVVRRPEVKVCLRKWGFRDPASYYRGSSYYENVSALAAVGLSPDPFPVFTDEPIGNVVRKIKTLLPPSPLLDATYGVPRWESREFDICFPLVGDSDYWVERYIEEMNSLSSRFATYVLSTSIHSNDIKRVYPDTRGTFDNTFKMSRDYCWEYFHDVNRRFQASKVVVSTQHFLYTDFLALANGCVLVKPESSNVSGSCDIFFPGNPHVLYCDHMFTGLPAYVQEALRREPSPEAVRSYQEMCLVSRWDHSFYRLCTDIVRGRERFGDITKVTPLV